MSSRTAAAAFSSVLLLGTPLLADGTEILKRCSKAKAFLSDEVKEISKADSLDVGYCLGFVTAAWHSLSVVDELAAHYGAPRRVACFPKGASAGQMVRVVTKYLTDHPERLHEEEYVLATAAILEAFPCDKLPAK